MSDTLIDLSKNLLKIAGSQFPSECKKFLRTEGNKAKRRVKAEAKRKVGKKTGNYMKGWKRGKPYVYAPDKSYAVRVYNASPHAHLIEYGHDIVGHEPNKINTGKRTKAVNVVPTVEDEFVDEFIDDIDKFIDELLDKGLS